jgi:glycosyltransferase involved in cell wall biosynthesis
MALNHKSESLQLTNPKIELENPPLESQRVYSKILIIGKYFEKRHGGGITMTNLFKGWDKNSLAVAATEINNPDFEICNNYYQLGSLEIQHKFPFNLNKKDKKNPSGVLREEVKENNSISTPAKESRIRSLYNGFLDFTGLIHYRQRLGYSDEFLKWVKDFSPDIIYSQLSQYELILFVSRLHEDLKVPIAIHIMDDWPSTIVKSCILKSHWNKVIDRKFRRLLCDAKVLMSISETMSIEYKKRYGHNFIPFHNPIEVEFWDTPSCTTQYSQNSQNPFVILYAGRIGPGIQNCFLDISEAIKNLIADGLNIELHIQVVNHNIVLDSLAKFNFVKFNSAVRYSELPSIFAKANLLLIPNDFDEKSISLLKFSMPTKASEYMVSGTPILVYSSIETAITKHALKHQWAFVVSEKKVEKLESAIRKVYENKDSGTKVSKTAKEFAKKNFDSKIIRNEFRKAFL